MCGHRCLHVDDVSHRIFSRSFRKYMTEAKVASPSLPKYLFSLPEVWDKQLRNVSKAFWKSPTQQPRRLGYSEAALLLPSLDYWYELREA